MKYTKEVLETAVRESISLAGVLRYLGMRQTGGGQTHIKRRITHFGIDTSHFKRQAHNRGNPSPRRRAPEQILVRRPKGSPRPKPFMLRRALLEIGVPHQCAACALPAEWHSRPMVLHVDHIDGDYENCELENLRFLCPNCHSQTATYAGRNRRRFGTDIPHISELPRTAPGCTKQELIALIGAVDAGELTVVQAARSIGCSQGHYHRLRKELADNGMVGPVGKVAKNRDREDAIRAMALSEPDAGPKRYVELLDEMGVTVKVAAVDHVLAKQGLSTRAARRAAVAELKRRLHCKMLFAGVAEWQTRWP